MIVESEHICHRLGRRLARVVTVEGVSDPVLWVSEGECRELENEPGQPGVHLHRQSVGHFRGHRIRVLPEDVVVAYDREIEAALQRRVVDAVEELSRIARALTAP